MKKVLFAATVVKTHIMEFHVPYLKLFKDMGWETEVAARNDYEDPADCVIPYCDRYTDIPFERNPLKPGNLCAYRMLKKEIDEGGFNIIHCHTPVGAILTRLAAGKARKKGTRVIYTAHGFHFFKGAPLINWLVYFPAEWLCSFLTDVLITINREDYAFAQKHMHAKKILYVPGVGVDVKRFGSFRETRAETRQAMGVGEKDFFLLSVGEMTPNKNHEMVIRAMKQLEDTSIQYFIAGRGERMEALKDQIGELHLEGRVHLLGYRNDVPKLYAAADAFVFPSFREGLSVALMEAMAAGLPCVVAPIRGNTDLISNGGEGLYMTHTPESIAEKVRTLYEDAALRQKLGAVAAKKVWMFDSGNVHETMRKIYLETQTE